MTYIGRLMEFMFIKFFHLCNHFFGKKDDFQASGWEKAAWWLLGTQVICKKSHAKWLSCCLQTHVPINLRGNWPVLVMWTPRSRCWMWNHRWICAHTIPCQQIRLNHSDRSQATEQMLALQKSLRVESNDITVTVDGTPLSLSPNVHEDPLSHSLKQAFTLSLVLPLACLAQS